MSDQLIRSPVKTICIRSRLMLTIFRQINATNGSSQNIQNFLRPRVLSLSIFTVNLLWGTVCRKISFYGDIFSLLKCNKTRDGLYYPKSLRLDFTVLSQFYDQTKSGFVMGFFSDPLSRDFWDHTGISKHFLNFSDFSLDSIFTQKPPLDQSCKSAENSSRRSLSTIYYALC